MYSKVCINYQPAERRHRNQRANSVLCARAIQIAVKYLHANFKLYRWAQFAVRVRRFRDTAVAQEWGSWKHFGNM